MENEKDHVTTSVKLKKLVRDIQDRTGWRYQGTLRIVREVGYDEVSQMVDDLGDEPTDEQLSDLRKTLDQKAKNERLDRTDNT